VRLLLLCLGYQLLAAASALGQTAGHAAPPTPPCPGLSPGPTRTVVRVMDGETLALHDGQELRLVGALSPRGIDVNADPGTWLPETKARDALEQLVLGKSVELALAGDRADRYERLLAQAVLIDGAERRWVQGHMLEQGYARAYVPPGTRACVPELLARERVAREASQGLWAEAAYQVRRAGQSAEIARYRTTYQIIEGRIARVRMARGTIYLNFGRHWQRGFSAFLRGSDRVELGISGDPQALAGRRVRVRGWIEGSRRPSINLSASGFIEVVNGSASPGPDPSPRP
jgi:micrococcal nuclease